MNAFSKKVENHERAVALLRDALQLRPAASNARITPGDEGEADQLALVDRGCRRSDRLSIPFSRNRKVRRHSGLSAFW